MKLYTKTETGEQVYLGKCAVIREEGGYTAYIQEKQRRLSVTGVFILVPSRFFYMRHRDMPIRVDVSGRSRIATVQLVIAIEGKIC